MTRGRCAADNATRRDRGGTLGADWPGERCSSGAGWVEFGGGSSVGGRCITVFPDNTAYYGILAAVGITTIPLRTNTVRTSRSTEPSQKPQKGRAGDVIARRLLDLLDLLDALSTLCAGPREPESGSSSKARIAFSVMPSRGEIWRGVPS
ncbi:hypothetical protein PVAR5_5709 [Paecilomyces variotii No. 5]|uniref:Uncharacterized protein n=1 Tax=Byssochlamys spectabilis (strain No. 5 / NBRC 109023) TaxID=1356009 RepID=V5I2D3_BYSSN|nr:hypothetical protein PVAR5_5709 [Paecilomyces variotii No. 5]